MTTDDLILSAMRVYSEWDERADLIMVKVFWTEQGDQMLFRYAKVDNGRMRFVGGQPNTYITEWDIVCERGDYINKKISLFDNAPNDATHLRLGIWLKSYDCWVKDLSPNRTQCKFKGYDEGDNDPWLSYKPKEVIDHGVLIPRPTKDEIDYVEFLADKANGHVLPMTEIASLNDRLHVEQAERLINGLVSEIETRSGFGTKTVHNIAEIIVNARWRPTK